MTTTRLLSFPVYQSGVVPLTPAPSASPSFDVYKNAGGSSPTHPSIAHLGGALFGFIVPDADVATGVAYLINTGALPAYYAGTDGGQLQAFALYDNAGAPLAGQSPSFSQYVDGAGGALTPPTIHDFGGGLYAFSPSDADYLAGVAWEIVCATANPSRFGGYAQKTDTGGTVVQIVYAKQAESVLPTSTILAGDALDTTWGTDVRTFPQLDPALALRGGPRVVAEAVGRRWTTRRGQLEFHPDVGWNIFDLINGEITMVTLYQAKAALEREAEQDERVERCVVQLSYDATNGVLTITATVALATGPFQFVVKVTKLTAALILQE